MTFWDFFWLMISFLLYVSYLVVLFLIVKDIFSDSTRTGWSKAVWVLVLIFLPVFGGLAYLIAFGQSMSLRQAARNDAARDDFDDYVRPHGRDQPCGADRPGQDLDGRRRADCGGIRRAQAARAPPVIRQPWPRTIHPRESDARPRCR